MIRIDGRPTVQGIGTSAPQRSGPSGQGFSLPTSEKAATAEKTSRTLSAHSAIPLDTLIAVQAQDDAQDRRKRQARRGHDLLDGLDRLKASLLSGRVPMAELERLKTILTMRRDATDDPRLDDVLAHVELRVAVELAKLGR
jgi:hypothetical protein